MGYFSRLSLAAQPVPAPEPTTQPVAAETAPTPKPSTVDEPPAAISLDARAPTAKPGDADDTAKRQAHEATEARRRAEWEARRQAKHAAAQAELDRIAAMSDEEVIATSTWRIGMDTEKLTRRNMKEAVQVRGMRNAGMTLEVRNFMDRWERQVLHGSVPGVAA